MCRWRKHPAPTITSYRSHSRYGPVKFSITTPAPPTCLASYFVKSLASASTPSPRRPFSTLLGSRIGIGMNAAGFNPAAGSGLRLRPRDLAKIGQLVLERGKWHGRQIVSSSWIEESTTPRLSGKGVMFDRPEGITSYGYLWWLGRPPPEHPERGMIAGAGDGGQRVVILPSLGAVVVTTAGLYGGQATGVAAVTTLNEFVFSVAG